MAENGPLVKAGWALLALFAVPLVAVLLLAWTLVGALCSLPGPASFALIALLVVTSGVIDPNLVLGGDDYTFDSSLLDPACIILAAYAIYLALLRQGYATSSAIVAGRRRLVALPIAVAVAGFLAVKLAAASDQEVQDRWRWKLAWLWSALVSSVAVYVSMAKWWVNTSIPRLKGAEAALLEAYGEVGFEQSVVSGLGTICVQGFHDDSVDAAAGGGAVGGAAHSQKPVLVLLHGYAAGNAFWMFILKDLSTRFRVVCVEMYGCGRSDRLPFNAKGPAEAEKLVVESLEEWRKQMGIEEMVLCGHSLGGMISCAYAMAHPRRIQKLFLLSPAGLGGIPPDPDYAQGSLFYKIYAFLWTRGLGFLGIFRWAGPFGTRMAKYMLARRLSWVPEAAKIKSVDGDMLGEYVYQLLALPPSGEKIIFPLLNPMLHAYRPVLETLRGYRTRRGSVESGRHPTMEGEEGLMEQDKGNAGISCPVSIIYGSPDHDWMPSRHGEALARRLTQEGVKAKVYTVPEAGHTLIIDNPEGVTRTFLEAYANSGV